MRFARRPYKVNPDVISAVELARLGEGKQVAALARDEGRDLEAIVTALALAEHIHKLRVSGSVEKEEEKEGAAHVAGTHESFCASRALYFLSSLRTAGLLRPLETIASPSQWEFDILLPVDLRLERS